MVTPNPLAARRRTNSSSLSGAVPSSWEESVVSGAIANRFAISRPQLNLKGDQTTIDRTSTQRLSKTPALMEDASGVDHDRLAGHGLGAAHRDHHVGAVVLVGGLLQERARCGAFDLLGPEIGCRAGALQQTRCYAVDERLGRQRHRHAARQMNEPRLRHGIGDGRAGWAEPCHRSYVDDAASPLGLHDRGYRPGQAHRPRQVDGHDLVPYLQRQIVEIAEGDRKVVSGVIDQNIKTAEGSGNLAYQPIHGRVVGYVTGESLSLDLITRR